LTNPQIKKLRECQKCGHKCYSRYTSHKKWCKETKKMVYCGCLRVVRDEA